MASSWVENVTFGLGMWYNVHHSPLRPTSFGSRSFNEPEAAFLGFAKGWSSFLSLSSFRVSKALYGIRISPLISNSSGYPDPLRVTGILLICRTLSVTSSPMTPSPRVNALKSFPSRYVRQMAVPSNFSSHEYVNGLLMAFEALVTKSSISPILYVLASESMGYLCSYCANSLRAVTNVLPFSSEFSKSLPTLRVGESGVTRSGYSFSRSASSYIRWSYS